MDLLHYDAEQNYFPQIDAEGVSEGLYKALHLLKRQEEVPSRDGTTREVMNCRFIFSEPRDRFIRLKGRKHNVFSQIGETLWVLSGTNKLDILSMFLPRAKQFSDDGGDTWRSGYGKRLRRYPDYTEHEPSQELFPSSVDQLQSILDKFSNSPETRRAFVVLTYPPVDHSDGIDVVCNVALHFLIRNGKLHMTIHNRSNDAIWGFSGINFFEFTVLQEVIVEILRNDYNMDVELGSFVHNSMSYHIYSRHYDRMNSILDKNGEIEVFDPKKHFRFTVSSLSQMDSDLNIWQEYVRRFREQKNSGVKFTDKDLRNFIISYFENSSRVSTVSTYGGATLLYLAKKHELSSDGISQSYSRWYQYYTEACRTIDIKPEVTYFVQQVNKKLID